MSEKTVAKIVFQILTAVNYIHSIGVIHRDLKMENILIDFEVNEHGEEEMICKLADFGFSTVLEYGQQTRKRLGTPLYMAPEIWKSQNYDTKVDIWALGILVYFLASGGRFPFNDFQEQKLNYKIRIVQPDLSFTKTTNYPDLLRDFLKSCL